MHVTGSCSRKKKVKLKLVHVTGSCSRKKNEFVQIKNCRYTKPHGLEDLLRKDVGEFEGVRGRLKGGSPAFFTTEQTAERMPETGALL